jgi:hypothetical protein
MLLQSHHLHLGIPRLFNERLHNISSLLLHATQLVLFDSDTLITIWRKNKKLPLTRLSQVSCYSSSQRLFSVCSSRKAWLLLQLEVAMAWFVEFLRLIQNAAVATQFLQVRQSVRFNIGVFRKYTYSRSYISYCFYDCTGTFYSSL